MGWGGMTPQLCCLCLARSADASTMLTVQHPLLLPPLTLSSTMRSTSTCVKGMAASSSSMKEWLAALLLLSCIAVFICASTSGLTVSVLYL